MADVVSLSALPSTWVGANIERIAGDLAGALVRALHVEAVAVALRGEDGEPIVAGQGDAAPLDEALARARSGGPPADGWQVAGVGPLGARGVIVAGRCAQEGMTAHGRSLLTLGANLADTALREAARSHQMASLQQQLARMEKLSALGQIASGVAHEIRTPLTYAGTNLELVRRELRVLPPAIHARVLEHLNEIEQAHDRIAAMVREMRRFHAPTGTPRAPRALSRVVEQAIRIFRATHIGPTLVRTTLDPRVNVEVDPFGIQQVVLNLWENAHEAMPSGGRIRVHVAQDAQNATLVVEDEGGGIPRELLPRIFEPFVTSRSQGNGLGLAIVRRIVEAHGGIIQVASGEGRGTRFTIRLPAVT